MCVCFLVDLSLYWITSTSKMSKLKLVWMNKRRNWRFRNIFKKFNPFGARNWASPSQQTYRIGHICVCIKSYFHKTVKSTTTKITNELLTQYTKKRQYYLLIPFFSTFLYTDAAVSSFMVCFHFFLFLSLHLWGVCRGFLRLKWYAFQISNDG